MLRFLEKQIFKFLHLVRKFYRKAKNEKTNGVRGLLIHDDKILLVQHRYNNLWVMPGGKIDQNISATLALKKEFEEEVGIDIKEFGRRLGTYKNVSGGKNDEVTVYIIEKWEKIAGHKKSLINWLEIKDVRWFKLSELDANVSGATRRRVSEYLQNMNEIEGDW